VDTHADSHVAAALDSIGGLLGVESFATTPDGYRQLLSWLAAFGEVGLVGIEGTGSYGTGLADTSRLRASGSSRSTGPIARIAGATKTADTRARRIEKAVTALTARQKRP
jgi:hypothetical protein